MRKLIITRGLPGSGKSHTLAELGLSDMTIGADALRLIMASPIMMSDGRMAISPEYDQVVWKQLYDILGHRMSRGEIVVVDATHPSEADFAGYLKLADEHRYEIACLDFSEVPADVSLWGNDGRAEHRVVPQKAVEKISAKMAAGKVPDGVHRIMARSNRSHLAEAKAWLDVPVVDLCDFQRVVHVGDIQGCHTALMTLLEGGLRDDTFYVFVGDYCDRGDENGEVMRWLIDNVMHRRHCVCVRGNHEQHVSLEARGLPPVSEEFAKFTLPQLQAAGITRNELEEFSSTLKDMFLYRFGRQQVMVTHAGLATAPSAPWLVPSRQCVRGTGFYEDDVDTQFARNAPEGWTQVHGHRNHHRRPIQATNNSFNLEGSVEAGGHMRGVVLDRDGWHPIEVANKVFRPYRNRRHREQDIVPPWMQRPDDRRLCMPMNLKAALEAHKEIRVRTTESFPHVKSYAFSKNAFFDKLFDELTVKARGLFVNDETLEIVSRSYDKFFNVGEREDTTLEALKDRLVFPLTLWQKENGFLGIIGYDRKTDSLFVTSKSTPEGDFAEWHREILAKTIPDEGRMHALKRMLRDWEASMAIEVIDPVRDPHMVEYAEPKLVLLDVIRRSSEFEKLPYEDLVRVGKTFGMEVKQKAITLKDWRSFEGWHKKAMGDMSRKIEGYVIEDAAGYQVKVKLPWYAFWKLARGAKDAILREMDGGKPARPLNPQFLETRGLGFTADLGREFVEWCREQDADSLRRDIITLRKAFEVNFELGNHPSIK